MPNIEHVGVHNFSCVFFFKTWTLGHSVTLKFLNVDLTGFAGTSLFNLPLPVYLAGKEDWEV